MLHKILFLFCGALISSCNVLADSTQIEQQLLAIQLANLGYAQKDPLMLMSAAKIIKNKPLENVSLVKTQSKQKPTRSKFKNEPYAASTLLNTAEQYARGKAALVMLIQELRDYSARGLSAGAKMHKDEILANGFDYYKLTFEADTIAKVGVVSDDSQQDLDLYIVDALKQDQIVCQDTSASSGSLCEWVPTKEQDYIIKIKNRSTSMSAYTLILN